MQLIELTDLKNNRIVINPRNICTLEEVIKLFDSYFYSYELIINSREIQLYTCETLSSADNNRLSKCLHKKFIDIKEQMNRSIYE